MHSLWYQDVERPAAAQMMRLDKAGQMRDADLFSFISFFFQGGAFFSQGSQVTSREDGQTGALEKKRREIGREAGSRETVIGREAGSRR